MENKIFIKIPHCLFTIEKNEFGEQVGISPFKQFGTEGFTIWSYLLLIQGSQPFARTDIKEIVTFFNASKSTAEKKAKNGLSDPRTIKKYLNILIQLKMIHIDQFEGKLILLDSMKKKEGFNPADYVSVRADDKLFINVNPMDDEKGFSAISAQLFIDYIQKIGHIGWGIYCLLFKNHNTSFGFASCSEEHIASILGRNKSTISEHINNLPEELIKIVPQTSTKIYDFKTGKEIVKYLPNHYAVLAKGDSTDPYYTNLKKPQAKDQIVL